MTLRFATDLDPGLRAGLGYADPAAALPDPRGRTVRCTPRRRTVMGPAGARVIHMIRLRIRARAPEESQNLRHFRSHRGVIECPTCNDEGPQKVGERRIDGN